MSSVKVTYGSEIRLRHELTAKLLKSLDKKFPAPSMSRFQMVVATSDESDRSTVWLVKPAHGSSRNMKGLPVKNGDLIRFEHVNTRANLHSHDIKEGHLAPLTRDHHHQEVCAFGIMGIGDENDDWQVELQRSDVWNFGERVRLYHHRTRHPLHSHGNLPDPIVTDGLQEVTAYLGKDENDYWKAEQVVIVSRSQLGSLDVGNNADYVRSLLKQFPECVRYAINRRRKRFLEIGDEASLQDLLFFMLKPAIPDLQPEQVVPGTNRRFSIQDFRSARLKLVVEAKFVGSKAHGKRIMTELHDDLLKYKKDRGVKEVVFFIYDPEKHLESPQSVIEDIAGKYAHEKRRFKAHCVVET